jgi:hypothetical protein
VEESYNEEKIQDAVMAFLDHGQPKGKHRAYLWAIYEFPLRVKGLETP